MREGIIRASVWERTHEGSHLFPKRLSRSVCPDSSGVRTRAYAYAHAHSTRIVPDNGGCSTVFPVMLDASRRRDASFDPFHLHFLLYLVICFPVKESNYLEKTLAKRNAILLFLKCYTYELCVS